MIWRRSVRRPRHASGARRFQIEALEDRQLLTTFYVANSGSDAHDGSLAAPFRTIQHGVDALEAGDTLLIRGGSYHEEVYKDNLKGTAAAPIVIASYPGEDVTLDGTIPITTNWEPHSGKIYKTTIDQHVWQLFVDDTMQVTARWPNVTVGHPTDPLAVKANGWEPRDGTWWDQDTTWALGADRHNNDGLITVDPSRLDVHGSPLDLAALGVSFEGGSLILNHHSELTFERAITSHVPGSNTFQHDPLVDPHDQREPYFYIEHLNALDLPGEWYYTPTVPDDLSIPGGTLYLYADDGQSPNGRNIRGKTQTYALDLDHADYVTIRGLNFFGTTFRSEDGTHITLENSRLSYPSFFARVLGEYEYFHGGAASERHGQSTKMRGPSSGSYNTFRNNVVEYTEGMALDMYKGFGNLLENNLFHHIDFSGIGQIGINIRRDGNALIARNTYHTGGGSAAFKHGSAEITLNHVYQFGYLQQDGAAFTVNSALSTGTVRSFNWWHHFPKYGGRWDGNTGENGTNHHNVGFAVDGAMQVKGDDHDTHNNTIFDSVRKNGIILLGEAGTKNQLSRTKNNLSDTIAGHRVASVTAYPIPGEHSHNWNGYVTHQDARTQLRDPDNFDFRPLEGADVVDAGSGLPGITDGFLGTAPDIGAYEFGDAAYWIPGQRVDKASTPVPPHASATVKADADLMWLLGREATSHRVYFGTNPEQLVFQGVQTTNIFDPGPLVSGRRYFWRIDEVTPSGTVTGELWTFTVPNGSGPLRGDYNADGDINQEDYQVWKDDFGSQTMLAADGNHNGVVDAGDFTVWREALALAAQAVVTETVGSSEVASSQASRVSEDGQPDQLPADPWPVPKRTSSARTYELKLGRDLRHPGPAQRHATDSNHGPRRPVPLASFTALSHLRGTHARLRRTVKQDSMIDVREREDHSNHKLGLTIAATDALFAQWVVRRC